MLGKAAQWHECALDLQRKGMFLLDSLSYNIGLDCQSEHQFWRPLVDQVTLSDERESLHFHSSVLVFNSPLFRKRKATDIKQFPVSLSYSLNFKNLGMIVCSLLRHGCFCHWFSLVFFWHDFWIGWLESTGISYRHVEHIYFPLNLAHGFDRSLGEKWMEHWWFKML